MSKVKGRIIESKNNSASKKPGFLTSKKQFFEGIL
jgi:hypothetical protein